MDQEALAVLKAIRGELVMLRNEFLMLRLAVEAIEKEVKKPKEQPQQPVRIDKVFGDATRIEKL
jgi:hypothetical protein